MNKSEKAKEILGFSGRMIGGSKSAYFREHPKNEPVFNANVCVASGKIWYGDLDLSLEGDREMLTRLADALGEPVYVLSELDGRFENEDNPQLDRAKGVFHPRGDA